MNEKLIEKKLKQGVERIGGKALKFTSPFYTGMPDRLVLLPGGKVKWAEIKSTGKVLSPVQDVRKAELEALGFEVAVIDDQQTLTHFLNNLTQ